jgi:hypothetical protein
LQPKWKTVTGKNNKPVRNSIKVPLGQKIIRNLKIKIKTEKNIPFNRDVQVSNVMKSKIDELLKFVVIDGVFETLNEGRVRTIK